MYNHKIKWLSIKIILYLSRCCLRPKGLRLRKPPGRALYGLGYSTTCFLYFILTKKHPLRMGGNSFGNAFRITTYGESHGGGIGVVIDGCPAGLPIAEEDIQRELDRRRPGQSDLTTPRKETDTVQVLSGIKDDEALGTPISLFIPNKDARSEDYSALKDVYRPSHGDYTWEAKYGRRDHRGGGRSSARETAARVAAGAIARLWLRQAHGLEIVSFVDQVGPVHLDRAFFPEAPSHTEVDAHPVRCPHPATAQQMRDAIEKARAMGDSLGGAISTYVRFCPAGWGEPVFDKLHADLAKAMMSINATRGFEIGEGFGAAAMHGSQHNDAFGTDDMGNVITRTNHSGGIQAGMSNGRPIYFRVAFKPVATIGKPQETVTSTGETTTLEAKGRHDPCVVPRAVPIVEAMTALVLADHGLRQQLNRFQPKQEASSFNIPM
jgi:chorismate synthase